MTFSFMFADAMPLYKGYENETRLYSPVTMNRQWPAIWRLVFIVLCSCFGTIMNGFFVSSFFVEHTLRRIGHVFHACMGVSDMIITSAVMPMAAVALLSGIWDILPVCEAMEFLTAAATYSYSIFFTLMAAETYYRFCRSSKDYENFVSMGIPFVAALVFLVSFTVAAAGTYLHLDYDYCRRAHFGHYNFRVISFTLIHGLAFIITCYYLFASYVEIHSRYRIQSYYRRSQQFERDLATVNLNLTAFFLYVFSWMPYLVVVYQFPDIDDSKYYHTAWIGISRSLVTSVMYSFLNKSFKRAFCHLFYYCCCKSNRPQPLRRHRRGAHRIRRREVHREIRTHIMQHAIIVTRPQRGSPQSQETLEL